MQVVFFPEELNARAPAAMGIFLAAPSNEWVSLWDILAAIQQREPVTIRPATESEIKRAEAWMAMFEIGQMLSEKLGTLLDQEPQEVATAKIDAFFNEAIMSTDTSFPGLLDIASAPTCGAAGATSYAGANVYRTAGYAYSQHGQA